MSDLRKLVNDAVKQFCDENNTSFKTLDEETIVNYCLTVVKSRVKQKETNKLGRELVKAYKEKARKLVNARENNVVKSTTDVE